ncbi:MAG: PPOX class F420-dependent oxidoreductase [Micromonosporaceae bacterium]
MTVALPELARHLLDGRVFAVLATVTGSGAPQSSVIWVKRDGDQVVFSTIRGRLKTRNLERDPRVSLCLYDPADPYAYVEIRGTVTMDEQGGPELIDELSRAYDGKPWTVRPHETRLVCRVTPTKVIEHVAAQSPRHQPPTPDLRS